MTKVSSISLNTTRPWDANTIDSARANASTTHSDILLHIDCSLQSRGWALGYFGHLKAHRDARDETVPKQPHVRGRSWKKRGNVRYKARIGRSGIIRTASTV